MSFGDPIFSLPDSGWLMIYDLILYRISELNDDTDDQGFPLTAGAPAVPIKAYVAQPDTRNLDRGGEASDITVLVRGSTVVNHRDQVEVPAALGLPVQMTGRFRITSVRPNQAHTRLLCTRVVDPPSALR